jgi:hypothetical protein
MARDSNGNYALPAGNPVAAGDTIQAAWANALAADVAAELTNSLDRYGRGGLVAAFKAPDGSVSAPGVAFTNGTNAGLYRAGAGDVRMAVGGADVQRWNAGVLSHWNGASWDPVVTTAYTDVTSSVTFASGLAAGADFSVRVYNSGLVSVTGDVDVTGSPTTCSFTLPAGARPLAYFSRPSIFRISPTTWSADVGNDTFFAASGSVNHFSTSAYSRTLNAVFMAA